MHEWATVSLREELLAEIRKVLKTGRYRSISEFVSEAIRLRLEEISYNKSHANPQEVSSTTTATQETTDVKVQTDIAVDRLEQVWLVLVKLFEDFIKMDLKPDVEIASKLRNCRTLINFIRAHSCPGCDREIAEHKMRDLQHSLEDIKDDLIVKALSVGEDYAKDWVKKIDEAERSDLSFITSVSTFTPSLPKNPDIGWIRLTLSKPIAAEKAREISKIFGVTTELLGDSQLVVKGDKASVKKAAQVLHRLQMHPTN